MKKFSIFFLMFALPPIYSMESDLFSDSHFSPKNSDFGELLATPQGRRILLTVRAAERKALNSARIEINSMGLQRFKPSEAFGRENFINQSDNFFTVLAIRDENVLKREINDFYEVVAAVADTEYFLIHQKKNLNTIYRRWYELSRRDDLILLKKIIENGEAAGSPHFILERLKATDKKWPPAHCDEVSPLSGFKLLQMILENNDKDSESSYADDEDDTEISSDNENDNNNKEFLRELSNSSKSLIELPFVKT